MALKWQYLVVTAFISVMNCIHLKTYCSFSAVVGYTISLLLEHEEERWGELGGGREKNRRKAAENYLNTFLMRPSDEMSSLTGLPSSSKRTLQHDYIICVQTEEETPTFKWWLWWLHRKKNLYPCWPCEVAADSFLLFRLKTYEHRKWKHGFRIKSNRRWNDRCPRHLFLTPSWPAACAPGRRGREFGSEPR